MKILKKLTLGLSILIFSQSAFAIEAGQILFAYGKVEIERNFKILNVRKGARIEVGDVVKTFNNSIAQIKLSDNTLLALKPNSAWSIKKYEYDKNNPSLGKMSSEIIKGGLRSITGRIGKAKPKNITYAVGTTTIGIRGTTFEVAKLSQGKDVKIFVKVETGKVEIANSKGQKLLILPNEVGAVINDAKPEKSSDKKIEEKLFAPVTDVLDLRATTQKAYNKDAGKTTNSSKPKQVNTQEQSLNSNTAPVVQINLPKAKTRVNAGIAKYYYVDINKLGTLEKAEDFFKKGETLPEEYQDFDKEDLTAKLKYIKYGNKIYGSFLNKTASPFTSIGYRLDASKINLQAINKLNQTYTYTSSGGKLNFVKQDSTGASSSNTAELKLDFANKKVAFANIKYTLGSTLGIGGTAYAFTTTAYDKNTSYILTNGEFGTNFSKVQQSGNDISQNVDFARMQGNLLNANYALANFVYKSKDAASPQKHWGFIQFSR